MNILAMFWGRTAGIVVGAVSLLVALLGIRHSIRKNAKDEMSAEITERAFEQIKRGEEIERKFDGMSDDDILTKLREQGFVRD
jgi:hypothetical protein